MWSMNFGLGIGPKRKRGRPSGRPLYKQVKGASPSFKWKLIHSSAHAAHAVGHTRHIFLFFRQFVNHCLSGEKNSCS